MTALPAQDLLAGQAERIRNAVGSVLPDNGSVQQPVVKRPPVAHEAPKPGPGAATTADLEEASGVLEDYLTTFDTDEATTASLQRAIAFLDREVSRRAVRSQKRTS